MISRLWETTYMHRSRMDNTRSLKNIYWACTMSHNLPGRRLHTAAPCRTCHMHCCRQPLRQATATQRLPYAEPGIALHPTLCRSGWARAARTPQTRGVNVTVTETEADMRTSEESKTTPSWEHSRHNHHGQHCRHHGVNTCRHSLH
jgi:hypothetical protein